MGGNRSEIGFFEFTEKFSLFVMNLVCCILAQILHLGKSGSWDMGENAFDQSTCTIFKLTISRKNWWKSLIFDVDADSWKLKVDWKILGWECHSGLRTLKLAVSQEVVNCINWFLVCWYKFRKAKSFFNNFWEVVFKIRCGIFSLGTLNSAVSQEWIDEMSWFFALMIQV